MNFVETVGLDVTQEAVVHRITTRIRQSVELQEILDKSVEEVCAYLRVDRVMIYQFQESGNGEVIAESIDRDRLPSLLGLNFPADDIPLWARELYLKTRQRSIVNVKLRQIGFSPLLCTDTGELLTTEEIYYRSVDPCHVDYLTAMGVQASLVVPILHQNLQARKVDPQLWGLLVCHHSEPWTVSLSDLRIVQQVADQLSMAIAQAVLLNETREKANREATINRISALLHTLPPVQLQDALDAFVNAMYGSGGRLYLMLDINKTSSFKPLYTCGKQPDTGAVGATDYLEQHPLWQTTFDARLTEAGVWAIADVQKHASLHELLPCFQSNGIRSLLVIPLKYHHQLLGYLTIFRDEVDIETLWAGQFDPDRRQQQPRQSFTAWRELRQNQVKAWTTDDLGLVQVLGQQFAIAIQHHYLYEQVHLLNDDLEQQVQARTTELWEALESVNVLRQITNEIRSTLNSKEVLQTIVREVRSLLNTDRVVIYQFTRNYQGEVVVEEVAGDWMSILGEIYDDICFPVEYALRYEKKGRISVINDVAASELHPCHINFLGRIQVKANLVVPIRIGTQLWGLLIAHECRAPRIWEASEVELLQQLADQAAIAIQQAEIYEKSCADAAAATEKSGQLEQTLQELKQTQLQLIQTEKMSSLGQLVAGVAHEINNPVNFIHGNLTLAHDYLQDLLKVLNLYRDGHTHTDPIVQQVTAEVDLAFLLDDLPRMLTSMRVGVDRIRQIVLTLRNFSRLDEADMKPVNIHEGIDSTLLILQNRFKTKSEQQGVQIIKQYGDLPLVECYAGQLNQVFMNIISNAIDALHHYELQQLAKGNLIHSKITISTQVLDTDWIEVSIKDNGPGMTEAVRSKLFDPFFTTKPVGEGTGLGLSISYQIVVEKHGGRFTCSSQPGEGADFRVQIPIKQSLVS